MLKECIFTKGDLYILSLWILLLMLLTSLTLFFESLLKIKYFYCSSLLCYIMLCTSGLLNFYITVVRKPFSINLDPPKELCFDSSQTV